MNPWTLLCYSTSTSSKRPGSTPAYKKSSDYASRVSSAQSKITTNVSNVSKTSAFSAKKTSSDDRSRAQASQSHERAKQVTEYVSIYDLAYLCRYTVSDLLKIEVIIETFIESTVLRNKCL